jgi:hypothetical protein
MIYVPSETEIEATHERDGLIDHTHLLVLQTGQSLVTNPRKRY